MKLTAIFARNLRLLRSKAGLTQSQLASLAGTNRGYIGKLEREANSPTLDKVEAIVIALQVDLDSMLDRDLPARMKAESDAQS
ncbi:helix-turn-helix domain-containing protein [Labrys sp. La1]|uniref:helix-turn-helix domain-containing protein n=1 Tax=Labrys sp. La1 TaxID=3404917 RepID=UPI003EBEE7E9